MSTASRDCGMAGGSCGGGRHAPATPGVRAWPRGYYDPRAAWQLGSRKAWPKCGPQDDNAAPPRKRADGQVANLTFARRALAPCFSSICAMRERRNRHSPPSSFPRPPP